LARKFCSGSFEQAVLNKHRSVKVAQLGKNAEEARTSSAASSEAVRTCIGCRKTDAREKLVRLVKSASETGEPEALVDLRRRMPGRGAWLHPSTKCLQLALKRRAIGRALPGVTSADGLEAVFAGFSGQAG
jgi:predicted RNA-binding protein YlxR (DUF448 family)